jgi:serine/threonine protein phosphatase PrpC
MKTLIIANAGDSRSVLCRGGTAVPLSYDHKPENEEERRRIEHAGSTITEGRVDGNLNLSRSLGDLKYK